MNVFSAENIKKFLSESGSASELDIVVHDTIDSTNTWALGECKAGRGLPFACFAEEQTAGRGRRGKAWVMSQRSNIAMSLAWPFNFSAQYLPLLPVSIALAIAEMLEGLNLKKVQVKWPNDVYVDGVKIAGVLIETQLRSEGRVFDEEGNKASNKASNKKGLAVVIGIGLNYDMRDVVKNSTDEPKLLFTDICAEIIKQKSLDGQVSTPERLVVASKLLQSVMCACRHYPENAESVLNAFREKYDYCQNKLVDVMLDDCSMITGIAKGITDNAELIVEVDGGVQFFNSADVSVKAGD